MSLQKALELLKKASVEIEKHLTPKVPKEKKTQNDSEEMQPVPYKRFKEVIAERNQLRQENEELKKQLGR